MRLIFRVFGWVFAAIRFCVWLAIFLVILLPLGFRFAAFVREDTSLAQAMPAQGRSIETSMGAIYTIEVGPAEGTPVLFAHGTAAWSEMWRPTMEAMAAQGYRAIAFDMPPFGYSERPHNGDYSRQKQAERILALVDAMEIKPIIVAHSFGAGAAVEAAMMRQDAFAGLVVVDGALGLNSHISPAPLIAPLRPHIMRQFAISVSATNPLATKYLLAYMLNVKEAATPELAAMLVRPMRRSGTTRTYADWLPTLVTAPVNALSTTEDGYKMLQLPVRYIWGAQDNINPLEQGQALLDITPNATLSTLPGIGHIPQIEAPDAFQALLLSVLDTI